METTTQGQVHDQARCQGWVLDWKRHIDHKCDRYGTLTVDGKSYCRRHTPDMLRARVQFFLRRRRRTDAALLCARYGTTLADVVRGGVSSNAAITRAQLEALERMAHGDGPHTPRERMLVTSALGLLRKNVGGLDDPLREPDEPEQHEGAVIAGAAA